jgi:hypothetical protein
MPYCQSRSIPHSQDSGAQNYFAAGTAVQVASSATGRQSDVALKMLFTVPVNL